MKKDDTIGLVAGTVGSTSSAVITSSVETYDTLEVTSGANGGDVSGIWTSFVAGIGGTGGTASGGNHAKANGDTGGNGNTGGGTDNDVTTAAAGIGGTAGHTDGNKGGNGGSGQTKYIQKLTTHAGESGKPGFIIVTLLSIDSDSGNDEGETPSQPSTTISTILAATSIQELKKRVHDELTRRCYYGNISSAAPSYNTPNKNVVAQANEINDNIVDKINLIDNTLLSDVIKNNPINYNYINNGVKAVGIDYYPNDNIDNTDKSFNKATHGCREACTGFCSTSCGNGCTDGCDNKCSETC